MNKTNSSRIKKQWLISFYIFHIGIYILGLGNQLLGPLIDGFPREFIDLTTADKLLVWLLISPVIFFIIAFLTYYCAYKKRGLIFLSFVILYLLFVIVLYLTKFISYANYDWSFTGCPTGIMLYQIFVVYISVYYLFNCYRLYRLNKV